MSKMNDFIRGNKKVEAFPLMDMLKKYHAFDNATNVGPQAPDTLKH